MSDVWYYAELDNLSALFQFWSLSASYTFSKTGKRGSYGIRASMIGVKRGRCRILHRGQTCYGTAKRVASACASMEMAPSHLFLCIALMVTSGSSGLVSLPCGRSKRPA
jgi:hypothetical protein